MSKVYEATDVGCVRPINEDSAAVFAPEVYVVADGMGGHAAGEVASHILVKSVRESLSGLPHIEEQDLREAIHRANHEILATVAQHPDCQGMGTTATMLHIEEGRAVWAHVGDSRLYLLRGESLQQVTRDHSYVEDLVEHGELTEAEARIHPQKNMLTRAVGVEESLEVDSGCFEVHLGDVLLLAPFGILLSGLIVLYLKAHPQSGIIHTESLLGISYLPWLAAVIVAAIVMQGVLVRRHMDTCLFPLVMLLASIGVVEIARLKPALLIPQLRWLLIAMVLMFFVIRFWNRIGRLVDYPYITGICCVVVLFLPILFGTEIGGSRNWLVLGPFSVQPSEFGKILIVLFLAAYLSDHRKVLTLPKRRLLFLQLPPLRFIAPLICIWSIAVLMFVVEKDLGSALLFFGIAVLMTYMATGSRSYVFLALLFMGIAAVICYMGFAHVRVRFDIWLNPWQDPNGMAYQVVQSLFAFGTGGVWGTGFGYGHPGFIPEVHTDFIFAAIAEEMGLIASLMLMACYVMAFWRGICIALSCPQEKELLLAAGCSALLLMQAFIIIAGVTKFLPLTGITLPFISYGGSSMVSGFILLGMLLSLSKERKNV